jgi:hypothetical protein
VISDTGDLEGIRPARQALKIVINIVYGLTSAKFDNPFRDIRNVDNIVAKRGRAVHDRAEACLAGQGHTRHSHQDGLGEDPRTDLTPEIIQFVTEFGAKYGYDFEHEETYDRFCLVNDAVYVAGIQTVPWEEGIPKVQVDRGGGTVPASLRVQDAVLRRGR